MGTFCSVIKFENLQELKRLCHWGPIIALGVIAICSTMAMIDSVLWYWPLHTTGRSVNFIMLINWTVVILYNYFNAMFVSPGFVPLGWKLEISQDTMHQVQITAESVNRCVMKTDHHCPWINNCCVYRNHALFTLFLLLAPLDCIHAAFIFVMTMYTQLYNRLSFGWNIVKINMSTARRDPLPIVPLGLAAFPATLFALGLALGTTIAVRTLFYYRLDEVFVFPYDMGSRWRNFKQVFTWSGVAEGDGLEWPVRDGCHQYSLTIEQLKQKAGKRVRSVRYKVIEDYSGACCPLNKVIKSFFTSPCTEEHRIQGLRYWLYEDKILDDSFIEGPTLVKMFFSSKVP
uniref:Palmitoyltransferase n=1 Tax=Saimiri boliviensis boliviensis TaxID=39432 RepID=A0A2K6V3E6_SAIBB